MITILTVGGSNFQHWKARPYSWPANLAIWNYPGGSTATGTAFDAPYPALVNLPAVMAAQIAARTGAEVRLINIAWGGKAIAKWLAGATDPNMHGVTRNNVTAALAALGVDEIDLFFFQNTNGDLGIWPGQFETMMAEFCAEPWFPPTVPVFLGGLPDVDSGGAWEAYNAVYRATVALDPRRKYYDVGVIPLEFWDTADTPRTHLTAAGIVHGGRWLANCVMHGFAEPKQPPAVVVEPGELPLPAVAYHRLGNHVFYDSAQAVMAGNIPGAGRVEVIAKVPANTIGLFRIGVWKTNGATSVNVLPTWETPTNPVWAGLPGITARAEVANVGNAVTVAVPVDANGKIAVDAAHADTKVDIFAIGYFI